MCFVIYDFTGKDFDRSLQGCGLNVTFATYSFRRKRKKRSVFLCMTTNMHSKMVSWHCWLTCDFSACCAQSAAELVREISTLELEVIHLERHLLSLYRTAFDQYLVSSPTSVCYTSKPTAQCTAGSMGHDDELQKAHEKNDATNPDVLFDKAYLSKSFKRIEEDPFNFRHTEQSHVCYPNIVTVCVSFTIYI